MSQPPPAPRPSADAASTDPEPTAPTIAADLTVNKVLAGAGAAATSAVLGSYFGATGTVAGAALGSVASTVATTLYQRSLDRTRDHIVARVRLPGRPSEPFEAPTVQLEAPQAGSLDDATTVLRVEPALRRPRPIWLWVGATVLVFAVGLLVVTGLEWAKGSSLTTGQPGTSVGRVLTPVDRQERSESTSEATPSADPTTESTATEEATSSAEPTSTDEPDSSDERGAPTRESDRSATATPLPTPEISVPAGPQDD